MDTIPDACGNLASLANTQADWTITAALALPFCYLLVYLMERGFTSPPVNIHLPRIHLSFPVFRHALPALLLLALAEPALSQDSNALITEACKLYERLQTLSEWIRNFFILVSVFILIFIGVQAYSGRLNWKHLAILGGSVAILALAHLVPQFFFTGECAAQNVTIVN